MNAETTEKLRDEEATEPLLSTEGIAVLNSARTILKQLAERCDLAARRQLRVAHDVLDDTLPWPSWLGRVEEAAVHAETGIFDALSRAHIYGRLLMSEDEVHNRPGLEGHRVISGTDGDAATEPVATVRVVDQYVAGPAISYVSDGDPFQGDSPGEHDRRL